MGLRFSRNGVVIRINLLIDRPLLKMSFEELDRTSFLSCTLLTLLEKPAVQTLSRLNKESPL